MPGFADNFMGARFALRTASIRVPELSAMFAEGEEPVFEVQGLDGVEWGLVLERIKKRRDTAKIIQKIVSGKAEDAGEAVRESLGLNDKLAVESAIRLEAFVSGVVSPAMSESQRLDVGKKMLKNFYEPFMRITGKIIELTGASDQGEAGGSGPTPTSESR